MSTAYRDGIPRTPAPDNEVAPEVAPELRPTADSWLESLGYEKKPGQREHIGLPSQTPGAKLGIAESGKHMPSEGTLSRFMASIAGVRIASPESTNVVKNCTVLPIQTSEIATEIVRMADQLPPAKLEAAIAAYLDEVR